MKYSFKVCQNVFSQGTIIIAIVSYVMKFNTKGLFKFVARVIVML